MVPLQNVISVNVLMACHNRAKLTERFFDSFEASIRDGFHFKFFVTDDGSSDETRSVLENQPFGLEIYEGSGELYWAKSMACAENLIQEVPDGILWVNDDLALYANAFEILKRAIQDHPHSVLVGQVQDSSKKNVIYGGYKRLGRHPLVLELINANHSYCQADTFNGNFVYIPIEIRIAVGGIDSSYEHAYADCDYGYRVKKMGFEIITMPEPVGMSDSNIPNWPNGRIQKLRQLLSKKHNPIKSQLRFFYLHGYTFKLFEMPFFILRPFFRILIMNSGQSLRKLNS